MIGPGASVQEVLAELKRKGTAATRRSMARYGIVAKRAGSPYRPNSLSHDWVKMTFALSPSLSADRMRFGAPPPRLGPRLTR